MANLYAWQTYMHGRMTNFVRALYTHGRHGESTLALAWTQITRYFQRTQDRKKNGYFEWTKKRARLEFCYSMELNLCRGWRILKWDSLPEPWAHLWMRLYQLPEAPLRSHLEAAHCSIPGAKWAFQLLFMMFCWYSANLEFCLVVVRSHG